MTTPGAAPRPLLYDHAKLRAWREESGLTRTQAAHQAGLSYPWLRSLESGLGRPSLESLAALAELYGHQAGELLMASDGVA
jgi:transcriptional regulator with XRE-family HTH domain